MIRHTIIPFALAAGMSGLALVPAQDVAPTPAAPPAPVAVPSLAVGPVVDVSPLRIEAPTVVSPVIGVPSVAPAVVSPPTVDIGPLASSAPVAVTAPAVGAVPSVSATPMAATPLRGVVVPLGSATAAAPRTSLVPHAEDDDRARRIALAREIEIIASQAAEAETSFERNTLEERLAALKAAAREAEGEMHRRGRDRRPDAPPPPRGDQREPRGELRAAPGENVKAQIEELARAIEVLASIGEHEAALAVQRRLEGLLSQVRESEPPGRRRDNVLRRRSDMDRELEIVRQRIAELQAAGEHEKADALARTLDAAAARMHDREARAHADTRPESDRRAEADAVWRRAAELEAQDRAESRPEPDARPRAEWRRQLVERELAAARDRIVELEQVGEHEQAGALRRRADEALDRMRQREDQARDAEMGERRTLGLARALRLADIEAELADAQRAAEAAEAAGQHERGETLRRRLTETRERLQQDEARVLREAREPRAPRGPRDTRPDGLPDLGDTVPERAAADAAEVRARLEQMHQTAAELGAAGRERQAARVLEEAMQLEHEMRSRSERGGAVARIRRPDHGNNNDIEQLRREVDELHELVQVLMKRVAEYHRNRE